LAILFVERRKHEAIGARRSQQRNRSLKMHWISQIASRSSHALEPSRGKTFAVFNRHQGLSWGASAKWWRWNQWL